MNTPDNGLHDFQLAASLGAEEKFEESEDAARRALAQGLDAPEVWLVLARALMGLAQFDAAEEAFRQAILRRPRFPQAHSELAQLIWLRTGDAAAACATLDIVIAANPNDPNFRLVKAKVLEYAGQPHAAYEQLADVISPGPSDPRIEIVAAQLCFAIDPGMALVHAENARALVPGDPAVLTTLCQANLALGRADVASAIAAELHLRQPRDQNAVALQAVAWRILGDSRYAKLYDYARFVRAYTIEAPPGWGTLGAYLTDLGRALAELHVTTAHPIGQSLRGGTQATRNLMRVDHPAIKAFFQAIDAPIRCHIAGLGKAPDYRLAGVWSVRLRPNGYHVSHVHPTGWISSACHIELPQAIERGHEGWLSFGEPGVPTRPTLGPEHYVKPEAGKLILFPSYMWHGTVPFGGHEARLTMAFDLENAAA